MALNHTEVHVSYNYENRLCTPEMEGYLFDLVVRNGQAHFSMVADVLNRR